MSSNVDKQNHESGRKLGNVLVKWKIHNYALTIFKPDCRISSPEFESRGPQTTIWQIILRPYVKKNGRGLFVLQLRRLDNEPTVVRADWKIELLVIEECPFHEKTGYAYIKGNSSHESLVSDDLRSIYANLKRFKSDTLLVNFQVIVSHVTTNNSFEESPYVGLNSLSRDLFALYKCGRHSDVEIRTRDKLIPSHKAILQCRSSYFKDYFENHENIYILDFCEFSYETMNNMLCYLYSGRLDVVLENPSIEMYDCAERFQLEEVKQYYCLDSLQVESKINGEKMHHEWHISEFKTTENYKIRVKIFKFSNIELLFNLLPDVRDGGNKFVMVSVKIRCDSEKRYILHLKVGIIIPYRKIRCVSQTAAFVENEAYSEFWRLSKELANCYVSVNGTLSIDIEFQLFDTDAFWENTVTFINHSPSFPNEAEHSYCRLSNDMRYLLASGSFSDSTFSVTEEKKFEVHKCILSARSYVFLTYFRKSSQQEVIRRIQKPHKANIFLDYLYGGILNNCSSSDAMELYGVADKYILPTLKHICSRFLLSCLTVENVSDIFLFADENEDTELKLSALELISLNYRDVSALQNFQQLKTSHPHLHNEACEFHEDNSRNSQAEILRNS